MAKKKSKKKAPNGAPEVRKGPRQRTLPGMEDKAVRSLDNLALRYDEVKKARMQLTEQEVESKENLRDMMHKLKRTHYRHKNISIDLVPEGEKVRVKVNSIDVDPDENVTPVEEPEEVTVDVEEPEEEESENESIPDAVEEL
jgi:uncharacterized protein YnzC (UPF0291/DUF896 family)